VKMRYVLLAVPLSLGLGRQTVYPQEVMRRRIRDDGKYNLIERHLGDPNFRKTHGAFKGRNLDMMKEALVRDSKEKVYFDIEPSDLSLVGKGRRLLGKERRKRR